MLANMGEQSVDEVNEGGTATGCSHTLKRLGSAEGSAHMSRQA
jgi:hypothetical protein